MTLLQGALLKTVNVAWDDFSAYIKRDRKAFQDLNAVVIPWLVGVRTCIGGAGDERQCASNPKRKGYPYE